MQSLLKSVVHVACLRTSGDPTRVDVSRGRLHHYQLGTWLG